MEEILENNKLIAEFMGLIYIPWNNLQGYSHPGWWRNINNLPKKSEGIQAFRQEFCKDATSKIGGSYLKCRMTRGLQYHSSWDWLMPVVQKIKWNTEPENMTTRMLGNQMNVYTTLEFVDIEKTYKAVVKFIKWYNESN